MQHGARVTRPRAPSGAASVYCDVITFKIFLLKKLCSDVSGCERSWTLFYLIHATHTRRPSPGCGWRRLYHHTSLLMSAWDISNLALMNYDNYWHLLFQAHSYMCTLGINNKFTRWVFWCYSIVHNFEYFFVLK